MIAIWSLGKLNLSFAAIMVLGRLLVSVGGGALVLLSVRGPTLAIRTLSCRPLRGLGRYCYGLYLLHPIIVVKGMVPARWLASHVTTGLSPLAWVLALTAGLSASWVLAALSWRLLESPCLAQGLVPLPTRIDRVVHPATPPVHVGRTTPPRRRRLHQRRTGLNPGDRRRAMTVECTPTPQSGTRPMMAAISSSAIQAKALALY